MCITHEDHGSAFGVVEDQKDDISQVTQRNREWMSDTGCEIQDRINALQTFSRRLSAL